MLYIRNIFVIIFLLNFGFNNSFYAQKQRVIIIPYGSALIDEQTQIELDEQGESVTLQYDGFNFTIH